MRNSFRGILGLATIIIALDQITKRWILGHFELGESRAVLPFMNLTFVENTGTAFGLFQGNNRLMAVVALFILIALIYSARGLAERGGIWGATGIGLVLGGAVGNMIDRIYHGRVIDFLDFKVWPVFNVADSAITVGTIALAASMWLVKEPAV